MITFITPFFINEITSSDIHHALRCIINGIIEFIIMNVTFSRYSAADR